MGDRRGVVPAPAERGRPTDKRAPLGSPVRVRPVPPYLDPNASPSRDPPDPFPHRHDHHPARSSSWALHPSTPSHPVSTLLWPRVRGRGPLPLPSSWQWTRGVSRVAPAPVRAATSTWASWAPQRLQQDNRTKRTQGTRVIKGKKAAKRTKGPWRRRGRVKRTG